MPKLISQKEFLKLFPHSVTVEEAFPEISDVIAFYQLDLDGAKAVAEAYEIIYTHYGPFITQANETMNRGLKKIFKQTQDARGHTWIVMPKR